MTLGPVLFFVETVLSEFQRLSQEGPSDADPIHKKFSNSIIATITSLPDLDLGLERVQGVLSGAAISPPSEPSFLANVWRQLLDNLPALLNENFVNGMEFCV
ncbi:hypothetical protein PHISCL_00832 [Aspergillus sclerotialis]|uniref:Uncharacterized protein n=1 Tax=Aspergillus sclerotialis TaxID=2070753 RepID=A0A3A2ZZK2_9EURO|nr:hypothetical protein PHISCL_00832 [Aspergillus sclerotialis]